MDILYRLFFLNLLMTGTITVSLPLVLFGKLYLRRHRRKYVMLHWKIVYLRCILPVTSASICILIPGLYRKYFNLTSKFGFEITDKNGTIFGVTEIFKNPIIVSDKFKICTIVWLAGFMILILNLYLSNRKLANILSASKSLGEDIYESSYIILPVRRGIFHKKIYLPKGYLAAETSWLIKHMDSRRGEGVKRLLITFISLFYWYNPIIWLYYLMWSNDNEIMADEKMIFSMDDSFRLKYAQGILNFKKIGLNAKKEQKKQNIYTMLNIYERNTESRARRVMYQKWYTCGGKISAVIYLVVLIGVLFFLPPVYNMWAGGTWQGTTSVKEEKSIFSDKKKKAVSEIVTTSPEGLKVVLRLEMTAGKSTKEGYIGSFDLVMYDELDQKLASLDMDEIFSKSVKKEYEFSKKMSLSVDDYNDDGIKEVTIGQKKAVTQKEFKKLFSKKNKAPDMTKYQVMQYSVLALKDSQIEVENQGINVVTKDKNCTESMALGKIDKLKDVFYVTMGDGKDYYKWNESLNQYEYRNYCDEDIENMQNELDEKGKASGEEHILSKDDGETVALVSTKKDTNDNEDIKSITLWPRGDEKKYTNVRGYYCDIMWVPVIGSEDSERYAMLIYNGVKARTFTIYDLKTKDEYFIQEDGTETLKKVFKQYNETDISFEEGNGVIYSLSEKNGDTLKIEFSAVATGDITVQGTYEYNIVKKEVANLNFTRKAN